MIKISRCIVCDAVTSGSLEFCRAHYHQFKDEIKDKKPWVKSLKNEAQRERRRKAKEQETSLDALLDPYFESNNY